MASTFIARGGWDRDVRRRVQHSKSHFCGSHCCPVRGLSQCGSALLCAAAPVWWPIQNCNKNQRKSGQKREILTLAKCHRAPVYESMCTWTLEVVYTKKYPQGNRQVDLPLKSSLPAGRSRIQSTMRHIIPELTVLLLKIWELSI